MDVYDFTAIKQGNILLMEGSSMHLFIYMVIIAGHH
jgi:hypothetical protein